MPEEKSRRYVDQNGNTYAEKPEHMTQLNGNLLIPKAHPRILFRGKLDSLSAKTMETQIAAREDGYSQVAKDLQDVAKFISAILMCEVIDAPFEMDKLIGLDADELRKISHNPWETCGTGHMQPHYEMGKTFVAVNALRTESREVELAAALAFSAPDGSITRPDIIRALNRLSSCVYIVMCRVLGNVYKRDARS
jgi:ethanolamine utilization cobalamin adenosyltransferase